MICDFCDEIEEVKETPIGRVCPTCMEEPYIQAMLKDCEDNDDNLLDIPAFLRKQAD